MAVFCLLEWGNLAKKVFYGVWGDLKGKNRAIFTF